jgi:O-antigen ligase
MVGLGAVVGLTAWLGVAFRSTRFAQLTDHRLWRGSSFITYPNAAAALLVPLALLAAGLLLRTGRTDPARSWAAVAVWLTLTGVGAAVSRAGFGVLVLGLVVVAVEAGIRRTVAALAGPVLGAAVTVVALAPSVPAGDRPQPLLACAGLLVGAAVTACAVRLPPRLAAIILCGVAGLGVVTATLLAMSDPGWLHAILASRATVDSSGRSGPLHAAGELIAHHPVIGYGVGVAQYIYVTSKGHIVFQPYAHDEYLQTLVDLGAIGVVLLLALFIALGRAVVRGRRPDPLWAAAVAGLIAFAVHSGFDFLWHLAVLPLAGGILAGLATGERQPVQPKENTE